MKTVVKLFAVFAILAMLAACGGSKPISLADAPVFPGASELQPGDSRLAATLANNMVQNAAVSKAGRLER